MVRTSLAASIFTPGFQANFFAISVPDYEIVQIHSVRHKRSASALEDVHRVNLATHGRNLRLELKPNHHLVPRQRALDLWYADAFPTNVSYSPADKVSKGCVIVGG